MVPNVATCETLLVAVDVAMSERFDPEMVGVPEVAVKIN
jgi:hypothetical protein